MAHETQTATAEAPREIAASPFQLIYALLLVGAGVLSVAALMWGIGHSDTSTGVLWAVGGLLAYLCVWAWGLSLAK
ncbi:MAG: hypothetical protein DIU63_04805 [Proteobacteria bacterium]|jgi:predicted membrane protein|nr:MAG: hypothetical protein DIU63_04805 [Pseudomonadota bacterium]